MLVILLVIGFDYVGIVVVDLDVVIEWYYDYFGMILVYEEINDD